MPQTNTSTSTIPDYIQQPTQSALGTLQSWLNSKNNYVYGSKTGESLFTPLAPSQKEAIGNVNWLSDQNLSKLTGADKAGSLLDQFASYDPGRIVDQNGSLGAISDYINPYLDEVLNPQIRNINEQLATNIRSNGANEAMAGAFGDARHGVVDSGLYRDASRNIADVTGQAHANAWDQAMGLRTGDRNAAIQQNANKATAAEGFAGLGQNYLNNFLDVNDALFNAGKVQHDTSEEQRQAVQQFQEALKNKDYDSALKLLSAVRGVPYTTSTTSTQKSDDGMWGILGSLLAGVLN